MEKIKLNGDKPFYIEVKFNTWSSIVEEKLLALADQQADILPGLKVKSIKQDINHDFHTEDIEVLKTIVDKLSNIITKYEIDNHEIGQNKETQQKLINGQNKENKQTTHQPKIHHNSWVEMTGEKVRIPTIQL